MQAIKQKIDSFFSTKTFYVFLLPIFFILFNLREIDYCAGWSELAIPTLALTVAVAVILFLHRLIFRSSPKAGILSFLLLGFILFYSDIYFLINTPAEILLQNRYILFLFFLIFSVTAVTLFRSKGTFTRLNHYLNTLLLLLCLFETGAVVRYVLQGNKWSCYISANDKLYHPTFVEPLSGRGGDIYLIIVDSYTSANSLKKYLGYDNSAFIDSMRHRGFYTAANATSNYAYTPLSLASLLNMDYLPGFNTVQNPVTRDVIAMSMINNSDVVRKLNDYGYERKNLSLFRLSGQEKFYTYDFLALPDYTLFSNKLFCKTVFFWYKIRGNIMYQPEVIQQQVDSTLAISREKRNHPVFVYTHFSIPHGPFYFNKDGSRMENISADHKIAYVEQLQYANTLVYDMVKKIQDNTNKGSIIIVLGDHGSRFFSNTADGAEDYSTLSSFYFPNQDYSGLYDSISHVNIFRTVFNEYFDEKLPRLEDKQDIYGEQPCR